MRWWKRFLGWSARQARKAVIGLEHASRDVTFVMQGPPNWLGYVSIPYYQRFGNVVVSCYDGDAPYLEELYPTITVVRSTPPGGHFHNRHNLFLQAYSSLKGLQAVNTKWAVKVRSDESFYGINQIVERVRSSADKLVTCNIFFMPLHHEPFCISDHIIGGKTAALTATFEQAVQICQDMAHSPHIQGTDLGLGWHRRGLPNEAVIFLAYLRGNNISLGDLGERKNEHFIRKLMTDHVDLVTIQQMAPFVWSQNSEKGRMYKDFVPDDPWVNSMGEI